MKIAQIAPLAEMVPPTRYGGTERIVSYLTEELVRLGHEVTLFASGDSKTSASLRPACRQALRLDSHISSPLAPTIMLLEDVYSMSKEFDIIHSHVDFIGFPLARRCGTPVLTTTHGRLDLPELIPVFNEFSDMPLASISNAQREPMQWANWEATIHNGIPRELYSFHSHPNSYLVYLGRITPEKCPDQAIEIAKRAGIPLRIAAKIDPVDRAYFHREIEPLLSHPLIEFVGEITDEEKDAFLGNALALLAPFDWPEPFGLVFIESLACGTPVITYPRGSVPEIIDHGTTGWICHSLDEMVEAVNHVHLLDRYHCRQVFVSRFTAERMVQEYLHTYEKLLRNRRGLLTIQELLLGKSSMHPRPAAHPNHHRTPSLRLRHEGEQEEPLPSEWQ